MFVNSSVNPQVNPPVKPEPCFHCGLPTKGDSSIPPYKVQKEYRNFCCYGCLTVCQTIIQSGLDDFYQFRTTSPKKAETDIIPDILNKLKIFDRPELQKSFVYANNGWLEASLMLEDIRCPACLWLNERHLRRQHGVLEVHIDTATQGMRLRWDPKATQLSSLLKSIADIGYIAHPYDAKHTQELIQTRKTRSIERLIFSGLLGMMVMNFSIARYILGADYAPNETPLWISIGAWSSLFVCTTLLAFPAQDFWLGAWRDLKLKRLGMDLPIVLGLSAAYFGSFYSLVTKIGDVYFDSIAMFIFFVLLARYFEVAGKLNAASYIDKLAKAVPHTAFKLVKKDWVETPIFDLTKNDIIRVLPGETVAADSIISRGESNLDESLLTGESLAVFKSVNDLIIAGSVNGGQTLYAKIKNTGHDTVLSSIQRLVDSALEKKPNVVLLADKVAQVFVPTILLLAGATALTGYWLEPNGWLPNTIAVLIVTCPCALALATPVALTVTAGRLVKMGILPINMAALERFSQANIIAIDKTGTLTRGQPSLSDIKFIQTHAEPQVMQLAYSLSINSEHPLAKAICTAHLKNASPINPIDVVNFKNKIGFGISGHINQVAYYLGNLNFILMQTSLDTKLINTINRIADSGQSLSILATKNSVLAVFCFKDALRKGAAKLIQNLHKKHRVDSVILSGDTLQNVALTAKELGIHQFNPALSPEQKLNWVKQSQQQGNIVLMFGDGVNDAPTLAAADVSFSISGASDLAHLSSDFVLLKQDISILSDAKTLATRCHKNMKQNILWVLAYNIVAVPLAILGFVPPWLAAIGMSISSLLVVSNALRLHK